MAKNKANLTNSKATNATKSTQVEKSSSFFNSPILRYVGGFVGLLIVFYVVYSSNFFDQYFLQPIVSTQTTISSVVLNLFGQENKADGITLTGSNNSLNVSKGCDGMEVSALYLIGILLMPFTWQSKGVGLFWGFLVLYLLNLLRIIGLFVTQIYMPSAFDFLHLHGGFALFTVVAIFMWMIWANWAIKKEKNTNHVLG
jgi:exosortase/archaeosortase family protein